MNISKFCDLLVGQIKTSAGIYFVIRHEFDGDTWLDSYLGNDENEALKQAEFNHCDKIPNIRLTVLGVEH